MRRIIFNEETINEIRDYFAEGHTMNEVCNRFTIKYDTLRRVMYENNIKPANISKSHPKVLCEDDIATLCKLYSTTHMTVTDICKEVKLEYHVVLDVLKHYFSEDYMNRRKSKLYRLSKLGFKNPMHGKSGSETPQWIGGIVDDGNGYDMIKKPDWYTGRKGSDYVFLHSVVMCEALGLTELPKGFVVHHIDGNKKNNDIDNLALITNPGHSKLHSLIRNLCKVQRLSHTGVGESRNA